MDGDGDYLVEEVVGEREMLLTCHHNGNVSRQFLVAGVPTKDLADGSRVNDRLRGTFRVTGTRKLGGRTVFVIEKRKGP